MTDPESLVARLDVLEAPLARSTLAPPGPPPRLRAPGPAPRRRGDRRALGGGPGVGAPGRVPRLLGGSDPGHPRRAGRRRAGADPLRAHENRSGPRRGARGAPPGRPAGVAAR